MNGVRRRILALALEAEFGPGSGRRRGDYTTEQQAFAEAEGLDVGCVRAADKLLATGLGYLYTIGEMSGVARGTVVLTAHGFVMEYAGNHWKRFGSWAEFPPLVDWLPARVLLEGGERERGGRGEDD